MGRGEAALEVGESAADKDTMDGGDDSDVVVTLSSPSSMLITSISCIAAACVAFCRVENIGISIIYIMGGLLGFLIPSWNLDP